MSSDLMSFALTPDEAEEKYNRFKKIDPFPDIEPALLNSADIMNYVAATGMIHPFDHESPGRLKPASYRVDALGTCIYWDKEGVKKKFTLERDKEFTLEPNSIVFIGVEPYF